MTYKYLTTEISRGDIKKHPDLPKQFKVTTQICNGTMTEEDYYLPVVELIELILKIN